MQQPPCPLPRGCQRCEGCRSCRSCAAPCSHAAPRMGPLLQVPPPLQGSCNTHEHRRSPGAPHPLAFSQKVCNVPPALCWCCRCPACIWILVQFMGFELFFFTVAGARVPQFALTGGRQPGSRGAGPCPGSGSGLDWWALVRGRDPAAPSHPRLLLPASTLHSHCMFYPMDKMSLKN